MTQTDDIKMVVTHDRQKRQPITAVWRNGGCSASYDSFVVGSSAVLRMNFCAKNPPLRQAAKRYARCYLTSRLYSSYKSFSIQKETLYLVIILEYSKSCVFWKNPSLN